MLGHASASITLDTYADLFDDVTGAHSRAREGRVIVVAERCDELEYARGPTRVRADAGTPSAAHFERS